MIKAEIGTRPGESHIVNNPPTSGYHRAREAEFELEREIDRLRASIGALRRSLTDARKSGDLALAASLLDELEVLDDELYALRREG